MSATRPMTRRPACGELSDSCVMVVVERVCVFDALARVVAVLRVGEKSMGTVGNPKRKSNNGKAQVEFTIENRNLYQSWEVISGLVALLHKIGCETSPSNLSSLVRVSFHSLACVISLMERSGVVQIPFCEDADKDEKPTSKAIAILSSICGT